MTAVLCALVVVTVAVPLRPVPGRRRLANGRAPGAWSWRHRWVLRSPTAGWSARTGRLQDPGAGAVADWCGDLARAIRAGDSLRTALARTAPADRSLRAATDPLRHGLERGLTIADATEATGASALDDARRGRRAAHLELACSVVAACGRLGGPAAAPLDRVAAALRQRVADEQERAAHAAQARLSAHVLTLVPFAVLGLLAATDHAVRSALASPAGAACVVVGTALNGAGWSWMRRIVGRVG